MKLPPNVIFKQMEIGPMENFQYFIGDERTKEIAVVDPSWDVDYLCGEAKKNGYKITAVFLTHGHPDHTNGVAQMVKRHPVPVYISKHELGILKPRVKNLIEVNDREKLKTGNIEWECFHTPGHSPGCQLFKHDDILIAGDTLFIDGCGRCDLPGSDPKRMYYSLYDVVMKMPDSTMIYPGHNYGPAPFATLASQKKTNPYLTCKSMEEFLSQRMGIFL
jgi:glyoxylase-like metal-dependent hydrolase (beta-lactamase superfamily II)